MADPGILGHELAADVSWEARRLAAEIAQVREKLKDVAVPHSAKHSEAALASLRGSLALRENVSALLTQAIQLAELFDEGGPIGALEEAGSASVPPVHPLTIPVFEVAD
eukprot:TRINITY_DN58578_c0_g1_i1.p2 TRINITY_DN58578_c0_g1~~TRINITY_DN58578_c0_g1_i1.p2  ORF type:complete len:109 (-),score=33.59 TRINITY_DN58578_c0_g1_i1:44-370(-)